MRFLHPRIDTPPLARRGRRSRLAPVLPWVFVIGVAVGTVATRSEWRQWLPDGSWIERKRDQPDEAQVLWQRAGGRDTRLAANAVRTIDGDTFEARIALEPGLTVMARIRLRGIDAPELHGMCADEMRRAQAAADALDGLLRQGEVTVYNVGPDKYEGRVVADVATRRTANVSAALVAAGHARAYEGGHRHGWCG